jgi:UDP-N-acetylmuramate: L-alanyl-gamma-D-glutamyl-meso-diaminopimelate ligase
MKIHLIAIGGSIMHNLAICLQKAGHNVTGSDDEIYEPARSNLMRYGLLPASMGWHPEALSMDLDLVILGMHAKMDNPELQKARELGLRVVSFPEYIGEHAQNQRRVVVSGSHGKTTTTSMILHVLKYWRYDFDYLVGAQLKGFDTMVSLTSAPQIVIEGDEYLSSCIDRVPKIWHYHPHLAIITGVAWDHMNVFPTLESYRDAFRGFLERLPPGAKVYYAADDPFLQAEIPKYEQLTGIAYQSFESEIVDGTSRIILDGKRQDLKIFGNHNMANLRAAYLVLRDLGVSGDQFLEAIATFEGAAKRLQLLKSVDGHAMFQDFAHAPSKVRATVAAVKQQFPGRKLTACIELHTYSSLNQAFLPQYRHSLDDADHAIVFYSEHTIQMKGMPRLDPDTIRQAFGREDIEVISSGGDLKRHLEGMSWHLHNLLLMSSGTFGGMDIGSLSTL